MSLQELNNTMAMAQARLSELKQKLHKRHSQFRYKQELIEDIESEERLIRDLDRRIKFINYLNRWH